MTCLALIHVVAHECQNGTKRTLMTEPGAGYAVIAEPLNSRIWLHPSTRWARLTPSLFNRLLRHFDQKTPSSRRLRR